MVEPGGVPRLRDQPGRSRPPRKLLDDIREAGESPAGRSINPAGELPTTAQEMLLDGGPDDRPESSLFSCPCCPAKHAASMMLAVEDLAGPMIDDLPADVAYICCWCDQHGHRTGGIDRSVP